MPSEACPHLQHFPVDALKIDRSFIGRMERNLESETLVRTLVQRGKAAEVELGWGGLG